MPENNVTYLLHNGELRDVESPLFRIGDGITRQGQGVFETIAVYQGHPFALEAHVERLRKGAGALDLSLPPLEKLLEQTTQLLEANHLSQFEKVRLKITLAAVGANDTDVILTTQPATESPQPATAISLPFARNDQGALTGLKTVNYGENVTALRTVKEAGAMEGLFCNTAGLLCEGIWCNVFVLFDGQWGTPTLASGCLPGITRQTILELNDPSLPRISEVEIPMEHLDQVEAGFLTSSIREIQPIATLDGRSLRTVDLPELDLWQRAYRNRVTEKG